MLDPKTLPLRDIHLPPAISPWWPLAPGWWLLAVVGVVLGLVAMAVWWWWRRTALRRAARRALSRIGAEFGAHQNRHRLAAELSLLCRQIALARDTGQSSNTTAAWLEALDRTSPQQFFSAGPGRILASAPYDPAANFDAQALLEGLTRWLARLPLAPRRPTADV
ncbi:MAG: DUF4381 domain-containing protein [Gammaproteobacteria bacterium]|nr:DUF4381 domain-containing protein [Gammaproteobacteria bacterium]